MICNLSLIDVKLQQLKKFLKARKKQLKKKYLKNLVDKQNNDQSEIQSSKLTNIIDDTHSKEVSNTTNLGKPVLASPSVRRFARELGCNLENVLGTGTKNRITHEDVKKHIKGILENVSIELYEIERVDVSGSIKNLGAATDDVTKKIVYRPLVFQKKYFQE